MKIQDKGLRSKFNRAGADPELMNRLDKTAVEVYRQNTDSKRQTTPTGPMKTRLLASIAIGLVLAGNVQGQPAPAPGTAVPATLVSNPVPAYESPWYTAFCKLVRAGIEPPVLLAYIDGAGTFNLTSDQIISLRDLGVPADVLSTMLQHDSEIALGLRPAPPSSVPPLSPALSAALAATGSRPAGDGRTTAQPVVPPQTATPASAIAERTPGAAPSETPQLANGAGTPCHIAQNASSCAESAEISPVRQPYAEPLTSPILMVKAVARVPNLIIIDPLR